MFRMDLVFGIHMDEIFMALKVNYVEALGRSPPLVKNGSVKKIKLLTGLGGWDRGMGNKWESNVCGRVPGVTASLLPDPLCANYYVQTTFPHLCSFRVPIQTPPPAAQQPSLQIAYN